MPVIVDSAGFDKLITWSNRYKHHKIFDKEIDRETMSISWHPERRYHFCVLKDKTKNSSKDVRLVILITKKRTIFEWYL